MKKFAVIMSIYKNDKLIFVKKSINSLLNQTYSNFNLYIQSDGVIKKECRDYILSIDDPRVCFRERKENLGLAKSLNELLVEEVLSKDYEYIARMDADDVCVESRFEKQIHFLESNKEVSCLGTWAIEINEDDTEYFRKKMPTTHEECFKLFEVRDCLIHPTVMFRKDYFHKAGLYPEDTYFGEDTIMWAQGFKAGLKFANLPEYLLNFRIDSKFFERRRGVKHAKSILSLRSRVNKMLNYGIRAKVYMYLYALAKIMPTKALNIIYKITR